MSAFGSSSALDHAVLHAARRGLSAERRIALRDAWGALWWSRVLVWGAGLLALLSIGAHGHNERAYDPAGLTRPFGALGDPLGLAVVPAHRKGRLRRRRQGGVLPALSAPDARRGRPVRLAVARRDPR